MRNSHCSMLLHNEGGGGHATEHSANHAAIMSGGDVSDGASSAEGERSARQRGGANGTGRFLKPFFFKLSLFVSSCCTQLGFGSTVA